MSGFQWQITLSTSTFSDTRRNPEWAAKIHLSMLICGAGHLTTQLTSRRSLCTYKMATVMYAAGNMAIKTRKQKPQPFTTFTTFVCNGSAENRVKNQLGSPKESILRKFSCSPWELMVDEQL